MVELPQELNLTMDEDSSHRPSKALDWQSEPFTSGYLGGEAGGGGDHFNADNQDRLPDLSVSLRRKTRSRQNLARYHGIVVEKQIDLEKLDQLIDRVNALCRGTGVRDLLDDPVNLEDCNVNEIFDILGDQLVNAEKKHRLSAIARQNYWSSEDGQRMPDKLVFDNVSVHLKTNYDEFKPVGRLSAVLTSAGGLYNGSSIKTRWEILDFIGQGSSGKVFRAKSKLLPDEYAAIKFIDKRSKGYRERTVCREVYCFHIIQLAGGHRNVVETYEVDEDERYVYIVMELLKGDMLLDRVSSAGIYTETNAVALVSQVIEALSFVHRLNIIHRDIKAENFVFAREGPFAPIKLIDFGVSLYSHDYGTVKGAELIVAPEMWAGEEYGQEVDMFSLGILVYLLLSGSPPFEETVRSAEVKLQGEVWSMLSDEGKSFLHGLLEKDPAKRLSSKEALEHPWLDAFDSSTSSSTLKIAQENIKGFIKRKMSKQIITEADLSTSEENRTPEADLSSADDASYDRKQDAQVDKEENSDAGSRSRPVSSFSKFFGFVRSLSRSGESSSEQNESDDSPTKLATRGW